MRHINLSEWAIDHHTLIVFFMLLISIAGIQSFFNLGRSEDPNFTIKTMVIRAYLPGASTQETIDQLTDRLEKKLQETPSLEYLKSYTLPGETTIFVNLLASTEKKDVPDIWYQVRKKISDIQYELPSETVGPYFDDEFGDTYGIIYALTSDGFSHRELKDYVESIRGELVRVKDVSKITAIGVQSEKIFIEFSPHTLSTLGINKDTIISALNQQNALTPSGKIDTDREQIIIETSGKFTSLDDLANITIYAGSRKIRLADISTISHGYSDPPEPLFRFNGHDAIGLGIVMKKGGDVLELEKNMTSAMNQIVQTLPAGIDIHLVANQPAVVRLAVKDFMKTLFEAVAIVLGLSFVSLGLRAGTVVAFSIPFVLALVFVGMEIFGIDLQRISLGALIISLGLLVDDAMITIESMVSKLEEGWPLKKAASFAYTSTAFPMLTGTLVTVCGFIPIGLAKSLAGEYCFTLFAVVSMSLIFSWFVAVLFAPPLGMKVLYENYKARESGHGKFMKLFERVLLYAMHNPKKTFILTIVIFGLSLAAVPLIPMQFFPPSDRPELLVDMTLKQGVSIRATDDISKRLDEVLAQDPDVEHWSSYVGRGAVRFYLPLDEQLPNDFFAQTVVITKGIKEREEVQKRLQTAFNNDFPEVLARVSAMEMGPPVGWPVAYRVSGKDIPLIEQYAKKAADIMVSSQGLQNISFNWGEPGRKLYIKIRQEEVRRLGLSSSEVAKAIYSAVSGVTATQLRDNIYLIDVVLRANKEDGRDIESLRMLDIPLPIGRSITLGALADVDYVQDYPLIWRRDRLPTVTVQADVRPGIMPATVVMELKEQMDELRASLPYGYRIEDAGTVEESTKAEDSVVATLPIMMIFMLCVLMIQLQNFRYLFLVLCVAPMGLIGVVIALLVSNNPMGFVALLGVVALVGMIVRNSVILVHQIDMEKEKGMNDWDAIIKATHVRFRPIMLTAVAAILGMLPIAFTTFWGPMANAIMGGLAVATALTLIFIPVCYVLCYNVKYSES